MRIQYSLMLIAVLLLGAGCSGLQLNNAKTDKTPSVSDLPKGQITIFVDQDCSHCKNVDNWVKQKKADQKLLIVFKEIFNDRVNAALMIDAAKRCNIPLEIAGVPLLWDGQQCRSTDEQILKYLQAELLKMDL
ncbi:MAG: hypothetical protein PHC53_03050 [Patescibacteria group bacterium]|nr:hypothetical protein [Patescibacteria group bacterium]